MSSSSSSSSSTEFSRPNPKNGLYDVFLSFRGIDTRYSFTANLFKSMISNKIHTFMDINNTGYDIKHLFEMVGISKIAVVIYSENFASSQWCLKELELILQRRKEKKMLIIPIFYNIDVHELQHLTGKTAEHLNKFIPKHGETTVQNWKEVVMTFGEVSGLSSKFRYEYDFIAEVIAKTNEKIKEWEEMLESTSKPYNSGHATKHDVFISFMGKDTMYGLVSHLYKTLIRKDIKTYMDDQDHLKNETTVFELIHQSKMAVIVFSDNYASSKWCLKELVKILQCRNDKKMHLLLIFFEITPSELINQAVKGSRISYHLEEHARNELLDTVKSWRDAIADLGYIIGWRYSTAHHSKRELAEFIEGLVEEISTNLNRVEDEKKELSRNEQHMSSAKLEEDTQALALQTDLRPHTTTGVYRILTSTYFQKSPEYTGKLLTVKPYCLWFFVEPEKESSTLLIFSNNTDNYVAFLIQCTTEPLKFRIYPSERIMLPHSTCQVIVTMEAQSSVFPSSKYVECSQRFLMHSVIAKNDSYNSTYDFCDQFKVESGNCIDKWWMKVVCIAPPKQLSSVPDHLSHLHNRGFVHRSTIAESIDTHPTKPWVLLGLENGSVCIWNYKTGLEEKWLRVFDGIAVYAKFIHGKQWFVGGSRNGFVYVFDYNTSEKVKEFKAHENGPICVAVHPNSPYVVTASHDMLVKLWNWENDWACIKTFEGHSNTVMHVAFNPKDSTSFATASLDGTIKLWSFDSSHPKFTINPYAKGLNCVEYFVGNDDKLYLLSGCDDYTARIWDYKSKTLVNTIEGHFDDVQTTLVHPNLPIIITGSRDKTIRIWNKNTHRLELVGRCDLGEIWRIGFIKASGEIVLGCSDGIIVIKIVNA